MSSAAVLTQIWTLLLGILLGVLFSRFSFVHTTLQTFDAEAGLRHDAPPPKCQPILTQKSTSLELVMPTVPEDSMETKSAPVVLNPHKRTGFCRHLPVGLSATALWKANQERIVRGTRAGLGDGPERTIPITYPEWLPKLFELLSTRFLRQGYKNQPQPSTMRQILEIVDKAMSKQGPPLNIAVLGGSVTQGRGSCVDHVAKKNKKKILIKNIMTICNWPMRLQALLDEFLGPNVTSVTNLAVGGTSTSLSTSIVKYKLYYADQKNTNYDIIVNAYSTNDALPTKENHTYDAEFQRSKREIAQNFIQACQESRPCSDLPLAIYVDDYIGNQHNAILAESSNGWLVHEIAEWTGTMFVSYASVVRRLVMSNQWETLLSGYWPWWSERTDPPRVNVHFGMTAHFGLAWVMGFSMLSSAVDYCEDAYNADKVGRLFPQWFPPIVMDLVERVPPPRLDASTKLEFVSDAWLENSKTLEKQRHRMCRNKEPEVDPCALSFVCGPAGTIRQPSELSSFIKYFTKNGYGWDVEDSVSEGGWTNKLGYTATKADASTTFVIKDSPVSVQAIKVYYLRSYGPKWDGSEAKFTLQGTTNDGSGTFGAHTFALKAYHASNTSISYEHELDLGEANAFPKGSNVELKVDVVSGNSFKITGLVMCNRP